MFFFLKMPPLLIMFGVVFYFSLFKITFPDTFAIFLLSLPVFILIFNILTLLWFSQVKLFFSLLVFIETLYVFFFLKSWSTFLYCVASLLFNPSDFVPWKTQILLSLVLCTISSTLGAFFFKYFFFPFNNQDP